jgi:hypothetical protein
MKKLIFYSCLLLISISASAQVPGYVPTNGLEGFWPFNGNANDVSGNNNNGFVSNAVLTADKSGIANSAYNFNGTNARIVTTNAPTLTGNYSISAWFNTQSLASWGTIVDCRPNAASGIGIEHNSNLSFTTSTGSSYNNTMSNFSIQTNTWLHVVVVYNGTHKLIYINGVLDKTQLYSNLILSTTQPFIFGDRGIMPSGPGNYFNGTLDDIGIWNRALTQQEITSLYTQNYVAQIPSYVPTNGLVGYWPFNGNANDESGNGNNGTVNGATLTLDKLGSSNGAYSFDGVNDYISTLLPGPLGNSSRTISIWFSSQDTSIQQLIGWGQQPPSGGEFNVLLSQLCKGVTVDVHNNYITYNTPNNLFNGSWHLITVVYDNNISLKLLGVKIYVDGVISGVINCQNPINVNINTLNTAINIGKYQAGGMWFTGKLDDIGIWNRALTQQEITSLYTQNYVAQIPSYIPSNGLVAYYPFNGNAYDASGNGNNGTVNGSILTNDRFGKPSAAYSFDGSNDYIDLNYLDTLNNLSSFTLSAWCKSSTNNVIFGHWNSTSNPTGAVGLNLNISTDNKIYIDMVAGQSYNSNIQIDTSIWNLICLSFDGNQTSNQDKIKLYLNGHLISVNLNGNTVPNQIGNKSNSTFFGARGIGPGGIGGYNNGLLDDIGIWNRALTEQEITSLYNGNICFETVRVTDTLVINVNRTGYNPITYSNTIKVYPNPANNKITIDNGDIQKMNGYSIKIINSLGQQVYQGAITQQIVSIDITQWAGNGMYYLQLTDNNGNIVDVKKIVLQ